MAHHFYFPTQPIAKTVGCVLRTAFYTVLFQLFSEEKSKPFILPTYKIIGIYFSLGGHRPTLQNRQTVFLPTSKECMLW